jgi:hypothetical protein
MIKNSIEKAKYYVKNMMILRTSDTIWQVGENKHIVMQVTKAGRSFFNCDCKNCTKFCSSEIMCSHILAVLFLEFNKNFINEFEKLKDEYTRMSTINMKVDTRIIRNELNTLFEKIFT